MEHTIITCLRKGLNEDLVYGLGVGDDMMKRNVTVFLFFILFPFLLTGCPRFAYIEIYNNTTALLIIDSSGFKKSVKPNQTIRFKFTGNTFNVKSQLGVWAYSRNIPGSGNDNLYFDGVLCVQVNMDGLIYVLKVGESPPLSNYSEQPNGYPLYPNLLSMMSI